MEVPEASVSSRRSLLGSGTTSKEAAIACLISWMEFSHMADKGNGPFSALTSNSGAANEEKSGTHLE